MIFKDKTILVTGGTGSMGKTLVHRLLAGEQGIPKKVIVLSRDEYRESMDIDFLVSDRLGYQALRHLLTGAQGINAIVRAGMVMPNFMYDWISRRNSFRE